MRRRNASLVVPLLVVTVVGIVAAPGNGAESSERSRTVACSFSNPAYSGFCRETKPLPREGS
ncbi:MAG: hypothetical protein ACRD3M_13910, partial [Thermoanaerobaculia bacterium]